ncbi:MAG: glycosyltransferase family 4 protein [Nitrosospira sp.]|nr:glycosyltransferase family 4 protein [Nitrosospira sp.]
MTPRKSFNHKNAQKLNGLNLIGPDADRGLGFTLESVRQSLKHKLPTHRMYLPAITKQKSKYIHQGNLFVGNPEMLLNALIQFPISPLYQNKNIGLFFWELEKIPLEWLRLRHWLDEIWVQSDFVLKTFKKMSVPVHKIPFVLNLKINKKLDRKYFKLPQKPFIFLFTFDYLSFYDRKNPEGVVSAFKKAFGNREDVYLLIKSTHANNDSIHARQLKSVIGQSLNIELRDQFLDSVEQLSLINLCDAYVSLHRSEGLGLGMAEAMALGKPVIATNYSGNLEFMSHKNSCLVKFTKVNLQKYSYLYSDDQVWAEPDINQAALLIKKIKDNKAFREKIAKQALIDMKRFTLKNQQQAILKRLEASHA